MEVTKGNQYEFLVTQNKRHCVGQVKPQVEHTNG